MLCDFCLKDIAPEADRVEKKPSEMKKPRFGYFHLACWMIVHESNRKTTKALNAQKEKKRGK